ncbi:MAG: YjjG family noncanonical pyrimidine nucleotidase [Clostridia bacterium]|nr:YjjG family noncanonical pyrimidine nucleotidase [Clostridia bacterium]
MTGRYTTLLFDADDTLFDFQKAERTALSRVLTNHHLPATDDILTRYNAINAALWREFEQNHITKEDIKNERYRRLFDEFGITPPVPPRTINDRYLEQLGACGFTLPGADALCRTLKDAGYDMYIVTNGVSATQKSRLENSGLKPYFDEMFVSEDLGAQKPLPAFFDAVLSRIPEQDRRRVLVIGDTLGSDIQGAVNAGLDCVWYNPTGKIKERSLPVTKEVRSFREIAQFLGCTLPRADAAGVPETKQNS